MNAIALLCMAVLTDPGRSIDFDTDIIPVLTKAGCNAGACHGAAAGRGGMRLSLLGSDPAADYETIVQALEGRRVNLTRPELSLFFRKPTGNLEHGGGVALDQDQAGAKRLLEWIRAGAVRGSPRRLIRVDATSAKNLPPTVPTVVPLQVVARFDNGPPEDVTEWTVFTSPDMFAVSIETKSPGGRSETAAHVNRRGQHVLIARYLDRVLPIQLNVPFSEAPIDLSGLARANYIDDEILAVLSELRIPVSPAASETTWLRRVTLDLTGRLPDPQDVLSFASNGDSDKRQKVVDKLLSSEAFADYWTLQLARLLRIHSLPGDTQIVKVYAGWLQAEIERGTGLDKVARELITATGDTRTNGPACFSRMVSDARSHADLVGQAFLGVRLGCANCHDHPLDKWTQDDFHGLAAVFARLDRDQVVRVLPRGAVTNLRTNEPAIPRIPGVRYLVDDEDPRLEFAHWLTSPENRGFPRATVNRLWRNMFGRGLVEPADDLRETNPPTHPRLLDRLADDFVEHGYSIRHTLRTIALSETYRLSDLTVSGNATDDRFYSHAWRRPLQPEVLLDAIVDVTGVPEQFQGQSDGTRAVTFIDPLHPAPALDKLGRCARPGGCDDDASRGLASELHLLNGVLINQKLVDPNGRLQRFIEQKQSNDQIVADFYVRALSRPASADELKGWLERLEATDADDRTRKLQDFVWGLLNSRQFSENH